MVVAHFAEGHGGYFAQDFLVANIVGKGGFVVETVIGLLLGDNEFIF